MRILDPEQRTGDSVDSAATPPVLPPLRLLSRVQTRENCVSGVCASFLTLIF